MSKIAIGKPITQADAANTGFVPVIDLVSIINTARQPGNVWANGRDVGGVMGWRFQSDRDGSWISQLQVATAVEPRSETGMDPELESDVGSSARAHASSVYSLKEIVTLICIFISFAFYS